MVLRQQLIEPGRDRLLAVDGTEAKCPFRVGYGAVHDILLTRMSGANVPSMPEDKPPDHFSAW